jgi:hypothetical protein
VLFDRGKPEDSAVIAGLFSCNAKNIIARGHAVAAALSQNLQISPLRKLIPPAARWRARPLARRDLCVVCLNAGQTVQGVNLNLIHCGANATLFRRLSRFRRYWLRRYFPAPGRTENQREPGSGCFFPC